MKYADAGQALYPNIKKTAQEKILQAGFFFVPAGFHPVQKGTVIYRI